MFVQRKTPKKYSFSGPKQKTVVGSNQLEAWTRKSVQPEVSVTKITMKVGSRAGIGFALTHFIQAAVGDLGWLATSGDTISQHQLFSALSPLLCLTSKVEYIAQEQPIVCQMTLKRCWEDQSDQKRFWSKLDIFLGFFPPPEHGWADSQKLEHEQ